MDRAFEGEGFCIVRGPDLLWGGDIRVFHPPVGVFDGVIGGPPCQAHSPLSHLVRARYGPEKVAEDLIPEFERVCAEAAPRWFLMENSPFAPIPSVPAYQVTSLIIDNRWLGEEQRRRRRFSFGTVDGRCLVMAGDDLVVFEAPIAEYAVTASRGSTAGLYRDRGGTLRPLATVEAHRRAAKRSISRIAQLQGLPSNFLADAPFTAEGKHRVIGNGVPLPLGRCVARAVKRAMEAVAPPAGEEER